MCNRQGDKLFNYSPNISGKKSEEIGEVLIENVISKFGTPEYMIMDQDSAFMSTLINYLIKRLGIKIKTVGPYNHQYLQAEHRIKSLSTILTKHLMGQGQNWNKLLCLATFAYKTFNTPNLCNHSPFELIFGRQPRIFTRFGNRP